MPMTSDEIKAMGIDFTRQVQNSEPFEARKTFNKLVDNEVENQIEKMTNDMAQNVVRTLTGDDSYGGDDCGGEVTPFDAAMGN